MLTTRRFFPLTLVALFLTGSALGAPIRSPYRQAAAASLQAKRAFAGEQCGLEPQLLLEGRQKGGGQRLPGRRSAAASGPVDGRPDPGRIARQAPPSRQRTTGSSPTTATISLQSPRTTGGVLSSFPIQWGAFLSTGTRANSG